MVALTSMEEKPFPAYSWSVEKCLKEYNVKLEKGLSSYEIDKKREGFGWNELDKEKGKPLWHLVLEQFDDMLTKILKVAASISFILAYLHGQESGEFGLEAYVEPFVIVLILVLDAIVGAKENMLFAGTTIVNGTCVCIVVNTGMRTEIGKILTQIHEASLNESEAPSKKLDEFGSRLTTAIGIVCLVVWIINYKYFLSWDVVNGWPTNFQFSFEKCTYYFKIHVALAVAAIPQGLPAVITTCLTLGTRKMAQKECHCQKARGGI